MKKLTLELSVTELREASDHVIEFGQPMPVAVTACMGRGERVEFVASAADLKIGDTVKVTIQKVE